MTIGEVIATRIFFRKLTQAEFAKLAGTTQSNISNIIAGKKSPTLKMLEKIAKALHTTVSELTKEVKR